MNFESALPLLALKPDGKLTLSTGKPLIFQEYDWTVLYTSEKDLVLVPANQERFQHFVTQMDSTLAKLQPGCESIGYFYDKVGKWGLRLKWNKYAKVGIKACDEPNLPPHYMDNFPLCPHTSVMKVNFSVSGLQKSTKDDGHVYIQKWIRELVVPVRSLSTLIPILKTDLYQVEDEEASYLANLTK